MTDVDKWANDLADSLEKETTPEAMRARIHKVLRIYTVEVVCDVTMRLSQIAHDYADEMGKAK